LEDVRAYRERLNAKAGMTSVFPLWRRPTRQFALEVIRAGFKSVVTCVDTAQLDGGFVGRPFDEALLRDLPGGVDPAAEGGEFHSFCYDGPIFREPVRFTLGDRVLRDGRFHYQDLLPVSP
jgi:diphthamide synthase (EF-2-diphthine--ammonia ligase)